jgi:hypothetical protein
VGRGAGREHDLPARVMQLSLYRIVPLSGPAVLDLTEFTVALNEHHVDAIEHVRLRPALDGLYIAVFTRADSQDGSDAAARCLINRALASDPRLHLWRIV